MSRTAIQCSQMYGMYFIRETLVSWRTDLTFFLSEVRNLNQNCNKKPDQAVSICF